MTDYATFPRSIELRHGDGASVVIYLPEEDAPGNTATFPDTATAYRAVNPLLRDEWVTPFEEGHC